MPPASRARIFESEAAGSRWQIAARAPAAPLADAVAGLQGFVEHSAGPVRRRELPSARVVVILQLGSALDVAEGGSPAPAVRHSAGFVAGAGGSFLMTEHAGHQAGIELRLPPLAARRLFGVPLTEIASGTRSLADLLPRAERSLCDELAEQRSWDARFDRVERFLAARIGPPPFGDARVAFALRLVERSAGRIGVAELARATGCSGKHLIALFRDAVGVTPKRMCRSVRFERLTQALRARPAARCAELAPELGYYDQAHLARDAGELAGLAPERLRAALLGQPEGSDAPALR